MREAFEVQTFHTALEKLWGLVRAANVYVDHEAPWSLHKEDPARMKTVLFLLAEILRRIAILAQPVVPIAAGKLLDQLAVPEDRREISFLNSEFGINPNVQLPKPEAIFPRFQEKG